MDEQFYIDDCLNLIEERIQWGPRNSWTTYNFNKLSSYIKESSGISLSSRTLRRLIKSSRTYKPQAATKNALAIYLGFKDWEEYLKSESAANGKFNTSHKNTSRLTVRMAFSLLTGNIWFYLILFITILIISSFVFYPDLVLRLNQSRVEFSSNYNPGSAPQRVTFFYDVSRVNSTNIFINKNFYDDGEIIPINKNRHFFTSDFTLPDHYSVKIIANGERISCIRIHVLTNGWEGVMNGLHLGEIPESEQGILTIPENLLIGQLDTGSSDYLVEYRNIREFNATGDAITLETEIRLQKDKFTGGCRESTIQLINLHGRIGFTFVEPGCEPSRLKAEFGDVLLNGEFHDLAAFYQDMDRWRRVKIMTEKKQIFVYLDNELIYFVKYRDPLHDVKGLTFKFNGPGQVNFVKLFNESRELIYEENF